MNMQKMVKYFTKIRVHSMGLFCMKNLPEWIKNHVRGENKIDYAKM